MAEEIFVALLDEGTSVWRPVAAENLTDQTYRIQPDVNPDDLGEKWEFPPGSTVVCQPRDAADGRILRAVRVARASG